MAQQTRIAMEAPTLDDLPKLERFFADVRDAYGDALWTEGQVHDQLTNKHANPAENYRLAMVGARVAGWVSAWYPEPTSERFFLGIEAHPREPAMFERLLDWGEERARRFGAGRTVRVHAGADSENELLAEVLRERGYELVRHFFRMEIELADEPAQPVWPDGITVRTFRPGEERAVFEADLEAFEDHWDFFPIPFEEWRDYFFGSDEFDPELWFIAEDSGEIAGAALCWGERRPDTGLVNVLGVRRPWRRRGLGTALLLHAFHEFRRRGRAKVDLNVDAESLTGAVRLYERAGMYVARRNDAYRKEIS
jgi:ribosomal protein S18 acetylase RimI-like enzyme